MKRILCSIALILALSGCTMDDMIALVITPAVSPPPLPVSETLEPTEYSTPSQTPTITQIPTFTSTPTLVGAGNSFDVPTDAAQALPTLIMIPTATSGPQISFSSQTGSLILSISVSSDTLFWGYCDAPKSLDFDVKLANNLRVRYVLLFLRLVDKGGNQSTGWGAGAIMSKAGENHYTYRITKEHLTHYNEFKDAWIEYQVVVSSGGLKILESSPVYERALSLRQCLTIEVDE